jgi:DNA-binding PadR family transcriptional regulator
MAGSHPRVLTLSPKELLVLELLRDRELYGLQLVAASRGRLKRGGIYVTLGRMEEKGLVASVPVDGGRRRYRATALGARALAAARVFSGQIKLRDLG